MATISKKMTRAMKAREWKRDFRTNKALYLFLLPGLVFLIMFCYIPMAGLVIVFKNYNFRDGIFGSPWAGFDNFEFFFYSFEKAARATFNTIFLNINFIIFGTIFAVFTAIVINEVRGNVFKKSVQSSIFLPYFLSWTVLGGILMTILDYRTGTFNSLIGSLGMSPIDFYKEAEYWPAILTISNIWKGIGYNSIVYIAVITGFDPSYYEAAVVDGATRMQRIFRITLPMLKPTIVMLTLLSVGRIFFGDLTMILGLTKGSPLLLPTTETIDLFVYRSAMQSGQFSYASAVALYQSICGFIIVLAANFFAGRFDKDYKIF